MDKRLAKAPLTEHDGHNTTTFTEDFCHTDSDGDLCIEMPHGDEKSIIGFRDFEQIDVSGAESG